MSGYDGKLSLKVYEPQISQRHEDVERNGDTTILLFSLKGFEILYQERRAQINAIMIKHFTSADNEKLNN